GPILSVPASLTINGSTYGRATSANPFGSVSNGVMYAYNIVHEDTVNGWTPRSRFGLEWHRNYLPPDGTAFAVGGAGDYTYNEVRSEEHTSELQSQSNLVCRLLLEKKKRPTSR